MDNLKRAFLPVMVIIIILGTLIFRLTSCTASNNSSPPSAQNSASVSDGPSPSSQANASQDKTDTLTKITAPYNDKEIHSIYNDLGLSIVEIRDAGTVTMVHYYSPTGVTGEIISRFDWFDRASGTRELVYGWAYTDQFEIKADKSFTALTTGLSPINGTQSFPLIFKASYSDVDGAVKLTGAEEKYYAPLDKSYTLGTARHECLTDINFNPDFISLGFGVQPGYEVEFYIAYVATPNMTIKNEAGYSTITLYNTILSDNFRKPAVAKNSYCSLETVTCDGTNTTIVLKLNDNAVSRYNVSADRSPANALPYAIIEYTKAGYSYPTGW